MHSTMIFWSKYCPEKDKRYFKWKLNNIWLSDDVSSEIYFKKIDQIKFPKNKFEIF